VENVEWVSSINFKWPVCIYHYANIFLINFKWHVYFQRWKIYIFGIYFVLWRNYFDTLMMYLFRLPLKLSRCKKIFISEHVYIVNFVCCLLAPHVPTAAWWSAARGHCCWFRMLRSYDFYSCYKCLKEDSFVQQLQHKSQFLSSFNVVLQP
jgi:hypothetical protein